MADIWVMAAGSIVIVTPITEEGQQWCDEWLSVDAPKWGEGYAVEHRYAPAILEGMVEDGLVLE